MTSYVTYNGALNTTCLHTESGTSIGTAAPRDNQGDGSAFSPTDLTATSLGACMLSIMGIYARNHELNIDGSIATVTKIMVAEPRRIGTIQVKIKMNLENANEATKQKLINTAHTCPVAKSLHPDIVQDITWEWE
jgi:uncharacterized OsmC-like protein